MIDLMVDAPKSSHTPSVSGSAAVFSKLEGTIWQNSRTNGDDFLFIEDGKYAIISYKKGTIPDRYPQDYQWIYLYDSNPISVDGLGGNVAVVYNEVDSIYYIGFYLVGNTYLNTSRGVSEDSISEESLGSGTEWTLHI